MKLVLTHGYSDSNKGDLAIVCGMLIAFRKVLGDIDIVVHSVFSEDDPEFEYHSRHIRRRNVEILSGIIPSPYIDDKMHGHFDNFKALWRLVYGIVLNISAKNSITLPGVLAKRARRAIEDYRDADFVISKGGQFIYNDQGYLRGLLYLWRVLEVINSAAQLGRPTYIMGQSIGPINHRVGRMLARRVLRRVTSIYVREAHTESLLLSLGIDRDKLHRIPDFAFLITPKKFPIQGLPIGTRPFAITVVNWYFPGAADVLHARSAYVNSMVAAIHRCSQELGLFPVFVPQVTARHHGESDLDLIEVIRAKLATLQCKSILLEDDFGPEEICGIYQQCEVLLGTRLHSCILAACAGVPVVAIRYQGFKTEGVMRELGMSAFVHDIAFLDETKIYTDISTLLRQRNAISVQLNERVEGFRRQIIDSVRVGLTARA